MAVIPALNVAAVRSEKIPIYEELVTLFLTLCVCHLWSYTNTAIAGNSTPGTDISPITVPSANIATPSASVTMPSAGIIA